MVGRQSVWSVHTLPFTPWFWTPGPTMPTQVEAISSWMSPWFQAKLWFVLSGMVTQGAVGGGAEQSAGVGPPVAKKNQSGSANGVNVGVRAGSAVIMWSVFISVLSARATMMLCSVWVVYGFTALSCAISRSSFRVTGSVWLGLPAMYTFGASSEWTLNRVLSPNCVLISRRRSPLISPT